MNIVILGAGTAGLSTALALGRDGHDVTLIERDALPAEEDWRPAFRWERKGIPHFLQPHAFLPRGRVEMRKHLPDVYEALMAAGAEEVNVAGRIPGPAQPGDEDLVFFSVRRPIIEWALRRAVAAQQGVKIRSGLRVTGVLSDGSQPPRVTGVTTLAGDGAGDVAGDLVVDAMGRSSPMPDWLVKQAGADPVLEEAGDCGQIYYSRYYALKPGVTLPDGPWLLSPRGDLGYGAYASFPGDNGTFGVAMSCSPHDTELKALLKEVDAYERAVTAIPMMAAWVNPDLVDPITPVLPMAGLRNTLRTFVVDGRPVARGAVPVADAYCHTNPSLALGLSYSLIHAFALADALRVGSGDIEVAFFDATYPTVEERFRLAVAADRDRLRMWSGDKINFLRRDGGSLPLFNAIVPMIAAMADGEIGRRALGKWGFLTPAADVDDDAALLERAEQVVAEMLAKNPPQKPIARDELIARMRA